MKLEILISCMNQEDDSLVGRSCITGDAVMINQCCRNGQRAAATERGTVRIFDETDRGLTKSRNLAIEKATADVCMLCDDDETFVPGYEEKILGAYEACPQADIIIFKMVNRKPSFQDRIMRLKFPQTMKVSSWQISFRRESLLRSGVRFDELLGAGTGNGAEEELKFLLDAQKAGLRIWYVPEEVAAVAQGASTWFAGYDARFFYNRGATTRYILGAPLAFAYAIYYVLRKKQLYGENLTAFQAFCAIMRGMRENKICKQEKERRNV